MAVGFLRLAKDRMRRRSRVGVDAHGAAPNVFEILTHEFGAVDLDDPWSGMIAVRYGTAPGPSIE